MTANGRSGLDAGGRAVNDAVAGGGPGPVGDGADEEKRRVAASSVAAAVLLTVGKLIVGVFSGSLGILSEALHSGLDLVAAVVTWVAVRASGRPADKEHSYGHGKVENISALFETVLLLVTCIWIIYEAVERLLGKSIEVEASVWAFLVMGVSIVVDFGRSRALARVARKYNSQALEADALHFSTDIWSSAVVILGLALVVVSEVTGVTWLAQADSVAALGVAGIVVVVSVKLGRRALGDLMDEAPPGLIARLEDHCRVEGVEGIRRMRVRMSGPQGFVDVTLAVPAGTTLAQGHSIADRVEAAAREVVPGADVLVHVEPDEAPAADRPLSVQTVRDLAAEQGIPVHSVRITRMGRRAMVEMHAEVAADLNVTQAHDLVDRFERIIQARHPEVERVVTHIEPAGDCESEVCELSQLQQIERIVKDVVEGDPTALEHKDLRVASRGRSIDLSFTCLVPCDASVSAAHRCTERVETALRASIDRVGAVSIHVEPLPPGTR